MPGWAELTSYSAVAALALGALQVFCFWGVGRLLCRDALRGTPAALGPVAECVAGVLAVSLTVQCLGMLQATTAGTLRALYVVELAAAALALRRTWGVRLPAAAHGTATNISGWLAPALLAGALLLAADAPATRADELSYHILAIARPLLDGGLHFHPLPWEASVVPQLVWHLALTPLYAVGGSVPCAVASACLALLLVCSMALLVSWQTSSALLGAVTAFLGLATGYSLVFFSTAGPHAFGYLATFLAVIAVAWSSELCRVVGVRAYVLLVALGCAGALASKITLLPVTALISVMALRDVWAQEPNPRARLWLLAVLAIVPAITLAPLLLWTWCTSGSPLGALTARLTHSAAFDAQSLAAYEGTRELFASRFQWRFEAAYWSLPMAVCALAALVLDRSAQRRWRLALITGFQLLVILALLPREIRHLGGIQYALLASGMAAIAARWSERGWSQRMLAALAGAAALPWALFVLWIASIYVPVISGRSSPAQFASRYAGLQDDYAALDRKLPAEAVLLIGHSRSDPTQYAWYARPPIWYAPRAVLFDTREVSATAPVYLVYLGAGDSGTRGPIPLDPWLPAGYRLGPSVYVNPQARFYPSRTPSGTPGLARLEVFALVR
jgi:hypothetical protein